MANEVDIQKKRFQIKPRGIGRNKLFGQEGELSNLMNLRYRDGALRPVQRGKYYGPKPIYDQFIIHTVATEDHWVGYDSTTRVIDEFEPVTSAVIQNIITLTPGETLVDIKPFKNFIIFTTSLGMYKYLYYDGSYIRMDITREIKLTVEAYDNTLINAWGDGYGDNHDEYGSAHEPTYTTNSYSAAEELKGWIYEQLALESENNSRIAGAISWVATYKLSDGSYIMQTTPQIQQSFFYNEGASTPIVNVEGWSIQDYTTSKDGGKYVSFYVNKWNVTIKVSDFAGMESEEKMISSICIFFSKPLLKYDIEKTIVNDRIDVADGEYYPFSKFNELTDDWTTLGSPQLGWFLVCEIPFKNIIDCEEATFVANDLMKLENFYTNYATRVALPVDQYTHHSINAENIFVYNSRLWLSGATRTLMSPLGVALTEASIMDVTGDDYLDKIADGYTRYDIDRAKIVFRLTVDGQKKVVVSDEFPIVGLISTFGLFYCQFPVIAYPDDRAYEATIYVHHENVWKEFLNVALTKSTTHNFAYYFDNDHETSLNEKIFKGGLITFSVSKQLVSLPVTTAASVQPSAVDNSLSSQVQLSSLSNPFVYPSSLNYQVGGGTVDWFVVTGDPMDTGQFGQYPVIASCSDGFWALNLGQGEVVVSSVTFICSDVAVSVPIGCKLGILFSTGDKIMLLQGREPSDVSINLRGPVSPLICNSAKALNPYFELYSEHDQITQLSESITDQNEFKDDLTNIILAYDHVNQRIICSKEGLFSSYVFDIETKLWYKISEVYSQFGTKTAELFGVSERGIIRLSDISSELTQDKIQCHFTSNILNFNTNQRKKLEQSLLRCSLHTDFAMYCTFAMWGSNDGLTWQFISGNDRKTNYINDIQISHSHCSLKFVIFAFWGELMPAFDNYIDLIEVDVKEKYSNKLRN